MKANQKGFESMWTERTELLIGKEGLDKLQASRIAVIGVGGVGGYAAEMLVRAGVGNLIIVDNDAVGMTNINRQLLALQSTVGRPKVEVLQERLMDINPELQLDLICDYILESNVSSLLGSFKIDLIVDAIDTLSPKIALIQYALAEGIKLVSSMGAGAKYDATAVKIADISKTYQCPLAHQLRKRLHRLGITSGFQAIFSSETPDRGSVIIEESRNKKSQVGTISYLPAVFGCACAQAAIMQILEIQ